jgi:hypothetical protein
MGKLPGRSRTRSFAVRRRLLVERLDDRRVLASITGAVFEDLNGSFRRESTEQGAASRLVFLDLNQDGSLNSGEPVRMTEADGSFRFDDVADGSYLIRVFSGASTQSQTVPLEASLSGTVVAVEQASQLLPFGSGYLALGSQSILVGDPVAGITHEILLGGQLTKMQPLPDGRILVVGADSTSATSWLVDPATWSATPIDLPVEGSEKETFAGENAAWTDVVIDGRGRGLLLRKSDEMYSLLAVDASQPGGDIQIHESSTRVPADAQVVSSDSGDRSVLAWSGSDGLKLVLWSNATESLITRRGREIPGVTELLAFDDASGLVALRTSDGGVGVYDVDADFASLRTFRGISGPVALDGERELLVTVSAQESLLQLYSLQDGESIAEFAVDLSAIGAVTALSLPSPQAIGVLGAAGIAEIALRRPRANQVVITDGQDPDPVLFGVALSGSNTPPTFESFPLDPWSTREDVAIQQIAPGILSRSLDLDGDDYVLVQRSPASHGVAVFSVDGSISYTPDPDFHGTDSVSFLLHDGRDASQEFSLSFSVTPVADAPTSIRFLIDPIPENLQPGLSVGSIEVSDGDGLAGLVFEVADPRFAIQGDQVIFLQGPLNFLTEPQLDVAITVTDPETGTTLKSQAALTVTMPNEPIRSIWPDRVSVREDDHGGVITTIVVVDDDNAQTHTLTVDDERFQFDGRELRLAPGASLDFETEPEVTVRVTATEDIRNGHSLTETILISVADVPEGPQAIMLSSEIVVEHVRGFVVGDVSIDGSAAVPRFQLSVDDSRFEIVEGRLKLMDDQFVEYAAQSEIQLQITATDSQHVFDSLSQTFVIYVRENDAACHNHQNPYDVDHSGHVTALDALAIINYLNTYGPGPVEPTDTGYCYDVNLDAMVTALDALLVLNEMNRIQRSGGTVGSGEGGQTNRLSAPPTKEVKSSPTPVAGNKDEVFGQWGSSRKSAPNASGPASSAATPDWTVDAVSESSREEFAQNVDQSLRLLTDSEQ